jgi:centrin-1
MCIECHHPGTGRISFEEFVSTMTPKLRSAATEEELRQAFSALDVDHNGVISDEDVRTLFTRLGHERNIRDDMPAMLKAAEIGTTVSGITFQGGETYHYLCAKR